MESERRGGMRVVYEEEVRTLTWEWGTIRILCDSQTTGASRMSFGIVESGSGGGHDLHSHADEEEIIYVLSGAGELLSAHSPPLPLRAGAMIFVPPGSLHATRTLSPEPMRVAIVYAPAGAERLLADLPGCVIHPPALPATERAGMHAAPRVPMTDGDDI